MTKNRDNTEDAAGSIDRAQALLDAVGNDVTRLAEAAAWLEEATARVGELEAYINGPVSDDVAAVYARDPAALTPPVGNEDAAWETLAEFDLAMMRLLRIVTVRLTSSLDVDLG